MHKIEQEAGKQAAGNQGNRQGGRRQGWIDSYSHSFPRNWAVRPNSARHEMTPSSIASG
ncbi:hypothetical protein KKF34_01785 [Myxococcota bacterium]|nr:hypothetical protein [Myxococcota bacterium]MBU1381855.1 hypothetical protein [Myxococcota bacterium]MBU1495590.1 hypothetical protein [Myxococcota bacterium]